MLRKKSNEALRRWSRRNRMKLSVDKADSTEWSSLSIRPTESNEAFGASAAPSSNWAPPRYQSFSRGCGWSRGSWWERSNEAIELSSNKKYKKVCQLTYYFESTLRFNPSYSVLLRKMNNGIMTKDNYTWLKPRQSQCNLEASAYKQRKLLLELLARRTSLLPCLNWILPAVTRQTTCLD